MARRATPNPTIGESLVDCPLCPEGRKARVRLRLSVIGQAYAYCNGDDDPEGRACGGSFRMGRTRTEAIRRALEAAPAPPAPPPANDNPAVPSAANDNGASDGFEQDRQPARKRGFWDF